MPRRDSAIIVKPGQVRATLGTRHLYATFLARIGDIVGTPALLEFKFDIDRRWRFDAAWQQQVAVEFEGAVWTRGRHTRGGGFTADIEKYNRAVELGWRVLRYTPEMLERDFDRCVFQVVEVVLRHAR